MKIVITKEIKNDKNINYFNARFAFPNFLLMKSDISYLT